MNKITDLGIILEKQWETLGITNDFIFFKIMQDARLAAELIRRTIPEIRLRRFVIQAQKTVGVGPDIHGVRFDTFIRDSKGRSITIEMQVLNTGSLPKRMRYYSSMADMSMLEKNVPYGRLKDTYIILICPFDLFGKGLNKYVFTNYCKEAGIELGDGVTYIVLNAVGSVNNVDKKLKNFLDFVAGKKPMDNFTSELDEAVKKARMNKIWRREYMTASQTLMEYQQIGLEQGRAEGLAEGEAIGVDRILNILLNRGTITQEVAEELRSEGITNNNNSNHQAIKSPAASSTS